MRVCDMSCMCASVCHVCSLFPDVNLTTLDPPYPETHCSSRGHPFTSHTIVVSAKSTVFFPDLPGFSTQTTQQGNPPCIVLRA